jgi:uncharacterized membrane protein
MVHFPIAFFVTSQALDILYGLSTNSSTASLVQSVYDTRPLLSDIGRMSYALNTLGVLTAIPTTVAGGLQFVKLVKQHQVLDKLKTAQSADEKLSVLKNVHPKLRIAFVHALLNDVVIAGAVWNWSSRSGNALNAPSWVNVLVSAVTAPFLVCAVLLGGKMVFDYGVGVAFGRQGSSKEE